MKTKYLFMAALGVLTLASCADNDFVGDESLRDNGQGVISFGFDVPMATRATGKDAATALSNQFVVYGEKSETTDGKAAADGKLVYKNYLVKWTDNSAYTTTSNTKNWEYVGIAATSDENTNISPNSGTEAQTIKYWDYSASNYVFTAVSALPADISGGKVKLTKVTAAETGNLVYDKGYTIEVTADADLSKLYVSDRNVISPTAGTDRDAQNAYGGNVTLTFRNVLSQVRVGMYENIPGHSVTIDKFYYIDNTAPTFSTMATVGTDKFYANVPNVASGTATTLTVKYVNTGTLVNQPIVTNSATAANYIALGGTDADHTGLKATAVLATSIAAPTFNETSGAFTPVYPQESNDKSLKLKMDYTLTAPITNEKIEVKGATAEIPAQYLQWKPNYKYTYIFKISDNTNGSTGQDVVGLYPITFDAIEIVAEDGTAEYITTVSEPSITTFGAIYNTTSAKYTAYQTGKNEYQAQTSPNQLDIYATFMEGSTVKTPVVGTSGAQHVNVFKVTAADANLITEAAVAEAIANPAMSVAIYTRSGDVGSYTYTLVTDATTITAGTTYYKADNSSKLPGEDGYSETEAVAGTDYKVGAKLNVTNITTDASTNFSAAPAKVESVPAEDGTTKTIDALKLTGVKAGTYAIEYEASAAWTGTYKKVYKVIKVAAGS